MWPTRRDDMNLGAGRPELNRLNARCDLALCVALLKTRSEARAWALSACPRSSVEVGTVMYLLSEGGKSVFPFYEASHVRGRWRAPILAEPDQTPHITMWHYGCGRLLRCGCAGSMRREGYGGCAGAVVLGYGRSAPLNTAVECSSSPQHRGSKATCRPPSLRAPRKIQKQGRTVFDVP